MCRQKFIPNIGWISICWSGAVDLNDGEDEVRHQNDGKRLYLYRCSKKMRQYSSSDMIITFEASSNERVCVWISIVQSWFHFRYCSKTPFSALTNFWLAFCTKSCPASTAHRTIPTTNSVAYLKSKIDRTIFWGILENNYRNLPKSGGRIFPSSSKNDIFGLLTSYFLINKKAIFYYFAYSCFKYVIIYYLFNH